MNALEKQNTALLSILAWVTILAISDLPNILLASYDVPWLLLTKTGFMFMFATVCYLSKTIRPLLPFAFVFLAFQITILASSWIRGTNIWQETFFGPQATYVRYYLGAFITDVILAAAVIGALWLLYGGKDRFFLVRGDLHAPIKPMRWLGIGEGKSWGTFGWIFAAIMGIGVLIPTILGTDVAEGQLLRAGPIALTGIGFAAINAFTEEVYFRASILATLTSVIGIQQALLLNAVFFGLDHWQYGSPPGLPGFLMTAFLAYILGKAMLETRGIMWPWFIHFVPDVVVFAAYAISWVQ